MPLNLDAIADLIQEIAQIAGSRFLGEVDAGSSCRGESNKNGTDFGEATFSWLVVACSRSRRGGAGDAVAFRQLAQSLSAFRGAQDGSMIGLEWFASNEPAHVNGNGHSLED